QLRHAGGEDGNDSPLEDRPGHVLEVVLRRRRPGRLEADLLTQDRPVQLLEPGTRVDAESLDEDAPPLLEGLERLRLATRPVERAHQLLAEPPAPRVPRV